MFMDRGLTPADGTIRDNLEELRTASLKQIEAWTLTGTGDTNISKDFEYFIYTFHDGVKLVGDVEGKRLNTLCILFDESTMNSPDDKVATREVSGNSSYNYTAVFEGERMVYRIPYKKLDDEKKISAIKERFAVHRGNSILVTNVKFSRTLKELLTAQPNLNRCEIFTMRRLMVNPNLSFLTPKHVKMTESVELRKIKSYITSESGIPFQSDIISKWWGWKPGEIIKISRDAIIPGSGDSIYYRLIGKSGSIAVSVLEDKPDEQEEIEEDFMNTELYDHT
jgi:DNA-directed RNA polymerase subunit H (RpoH/RPB5)